MQDERARVPANAEIVLEGYIDKDEPQEWRGPFGDHTGYYTAPEPFPVFHVSAVMRRDAIYPSIVVGNRRRRTWLGKATERIFLPAIKMTVPEIVDYDLLSPAPSTTAASSRSGRRSPATRAR